MKEAILRIRRVEALSLLPHELAGPTPPEVINHYLRLALLELDERLAELEKARDAEHQACKQE